MRNLLRGPRVLSLIAVTGLFLLFQNMTPNELGGKAALKPNEILHESDARGLLSMYYGDGANREVQNSKFLNFLILEQLEKSLPPDYNHVLSRSLKP